MEQSSCLIGVTVMSHLAPDSKVFVIGSGLSVAADHCLLLPFSLVWRRKISLQTTTMKAFTLIVSGVALDGGTKGSIAIA